MSDFKSIKERDDWIVAHAAYFTVVRLKDRRYERYEAKTLNDARILAKTLGTNKFGKAWMIYAVTEGGRDTFVEAIQCDWCEAGGQLLMKMWEQQK